MLGLLAASFTQLAGFAQLAAGQSYELHAVSSPFSYRAILEGTAVEELAADTAHTALFYLTAAGARYLESPVSFDTTSTSLDAEYHTSDGRRAHLSIRPVGGPDTPIIGFRVDLTFAPDDGIFGVGEMLRARFDERFTFRSPDSTVKDARRRMIELENPPVDEPENPPVDEWDDQPVDEWDDRPVERSAPSYWSSAGYGVILYTPGRGYLDLGSRVADIIRLYLRGTALSYTVVFGDFEDVFWEDVQAARP